jgi:hypothetical protein
LAISTEGRPKQPLDLDVTLEAQKTLAAILGVAVEQLPPPRKL